MAHPPNAGARIEAVSYLRVSGKGQVRGDGLDRQRDAIAQFARANGYTLVQEFTDAGVSGTKELDARSGLAALLDRLESNGVRIVIVERADRLARDLMVSEVIVAQFAKIGARVLTADGADLTTADDDPTRTLIRQVLSAVAQFDKTVTVLKLRAARARCRRQTGRCEGRKPYGFYPGEAQGLERLLTLAKLRGLSLRGMAHALQTEGVRTRSGRPWTAGSVQRILRRARATQSRARGNQGSSREHA